jgi:hypothetical protein
VLLAGDRAALQDSEFVRKAYLGVEPSVSLRGAQRRSNLDGNGIASSLQLLAMTQGERQNGRKHSASITSE